MKLGSKTVDFGRVIFMADSAGANIVHHMAMRSHVGSDLKVSGVWLSHPHLWGKEPIGIEETDEFCGKKKWWTIDGCLFAVPEKGAMIRMLTRLWVGQ